MHDRLSGDRLTDCIHHLFGCETPKHGDDAIVTANGMKSQGKRNEPQSGGRDPAASDVAHHHPYARDTSHLAKESYRVGVGKVVQNL